MTSPLTHLDAQATELATFAANLDRLAAQRKVRLQVPFAPLTESGLLAKLSMAERISGSCMRDAVRYEREGKGDLIPIALDDARRWAERAEDFEAAYQGRPR